ncbi:MAG: PAS domain S-box protein [Nitrospirae bacterium]|nr:PAS domain S-box protein [Nitrospirota bacterium]
MKGIDKAKLFLVLLSIFLIILTTHLLLLFGEARKGLNSDIEMRLKLAGEMVLREIDLHRNETSSDPYFLYSLGNRLSLSRISIMDPEGKNIMDSAASTAPGKSYTLLGISGSDLKRVSAGEVIISSTYKDENGRSVRSIFLPLKEGEGEVKNILRVSLNLTTAIEMEKAVPTYYFLRVFGFVIVFVFAYYSLRGIIVSQRRVSSPESGSGTSGETGLMLDTFHSVIQSLKGKEEELERLRTQAEEKAVHIESYNEDILRSVTSGVITFSRERIITTFNSTAEKILGISKETAIGKTCDILFGSGKITQMLDWSIEKGEGISRQEFELIRRDNEKIWVGVSTSLLKDREDRVTGTTFLFTDLTEIKRLQEELRFKDRLTVLGEMSAGIAHEFRNYMGTVVGFSRLLSKKMEKDDPRQGVVEAINNELKDMNRLIDELLSFGRKTALNLQPVRIDQLINKLLMPIIDQAKVPKPDVKLYMEEGIPEVMIDEVLMRQAIGNIVQNAVEAMPGGGMLEIRVKTGLVLKEIGSRRLEIFISDTGSGMPKERLDKIFLPFFTTKEKGTGLGLALSHKVIMSHNGSIEVESQEGKGTVFRLYIPFREQ